MGVTSVAIQLTIVDLLSKGVDSIKNRLKSLSHASKELQQDFDRMGKSFKYAMISGIATKEIYKGLKPAISVAGDLQYEMAKAKSELMGAGKNAHILQSEMKAIKASAFSIQAWTPFDMTQIVALEKELLKAGATVEQVTGKAGAAAAAAALATYEGVDPVETGKSLIRIATPFKLTADKYMELADMVSRASAASTADIQDIVYSAKYAAGTLAGMGKSTKEMLAFSAIMAQIGLQGETGGRAIREFFQQAAKYKEFKNAKGELLDTTTIIHKLKQAMKGLGSAERETKLKKLFGELGGEAARGLLAEGDNSYEYILESMDKAAGLQDKINETMNTFKGQLESLKGTVKSTIADLYLPALPILTGLIAKTNELFTLTGKASQENEKISKAVSGVSLGAVATGASASILLGGAGLYYGRKVLKGAGGIKGLLKGAGGTAAGIAQGKAVEATTGVTPVFVTNWPTNFGGSAADTAAGLAGKAGALKKLMSMGSLAFGGGYAIGTGINLLLNKYASAVTGDKDASIGGILYDLLHKKEKTEIKNQIPMNIYIDRDNRVTVENQGMNTETKINLPRGRQ